MSKLFKRTGIFIIALVAMIIIIPFFIPVNYYKPTIEHKVKEYIKRDFKIDGDINFTILPNISLKLHELKLASLPSFSQAQFVTAEKVQIILELSSLLRGKIVIKAIELENPEVNLEVLNSVKNWEIGDKPKEGAKEATPGTSLYIENIKISDGKIRYIDNGQITSLTNLNLDGAMEAIGSPIKANIAFNLITPKVKGDVIVKGKLEYFENICKFNGSVKALDSDFNLSGQVDVASARPKLLLDLKTTSLNLDRILEKSTAVSSERFSSDKINLEFLDMLDAIVSFDIAKLKYGQLSLDSLKGKASITAGVLQINPLTTNIYGGNLNLAATVKGSASQNWSLKADLKNANLSSIAPSDSKFKITKGALNINGNLNSQGNSVKSYVNSLAGVVALDVNDGVVNGFDLSKIVDSINNINNVKNLPAIINLINNAVSGGSTKFKSLVSNLSIKNGIATIDNCNLVADGATATARGAVNLPSYSMNVTGSVIVGKFPAIGANFYGAIDNPSYKLDLTSLKSYFTNNAMDSVINSIGKGSTKPKDILKGIIGGSNNKSNSSDSGAQGQDAPAKAIEGAIKNLFK
jgi:AsmA protein